MFLPNAHTEQLGIIFSQINTSCKFCLFMNNPQLEITFTNGYKILLNKFRYFCWIPNSPIATLTCDVGGIRPLAIELAFAECLLSARQDADYFTCNIFM